MKMWSFLEGCGLGRSWQGGRVEKTAKENEGSSTSIVVFTVRNTIFPPSRFRRKHFQLSSDKGIFNLIGSKESRFLVDLLFIL